MQQIEGFGSPSQPPLGDGLFVKPASTFRTVVCFLLVLPACALLVVAARTGAKGRDQRFALITAVGGGWPARALLSLGDSIAPILVGAAGGLLGALLLTGTDLRVPFVDYALSAADLRGGAGRLLAACLLAGVVCAVAVVAADGAGPRRRGGTRPAGTRRHPVRTAALAPVMLLVATRGPDLFVPGSPAHLLVNYVGVAGSLLTLPAVVGLGTTRLGALLAALAGRWRLSGTLLAGRWLAAEPGAVARVTVGIIAAVCVLVQVQVWTTFLGSPVRDARVAVATAGDEIQIVKVKSDSSPGQLADFHAAVAGLALPVRITNSPASRTVRFVGPCPALTRLDLPCDARAEVRPRQERTRMLIDIFDSPGYRAESSAGDPAGAVTERDSFTVDVLVAEDGTALDRAAAEAVAYRTLPGGADLSPVGGDWLIGAAVNADQSRWVSLFGAAGLFILSLTFALGALGEYVRWGRTIAPVSVLSGNRRVFWSSAAWSVFVPVLLAGALAIPMAVLLALPQTQQGRSSVSVALLHVCAAGIGLLALAVYGWAVRSSRRTGDRWLPSGG